MVALKGLLSSLLHYQPEDISSIEITNPIVLGEAFTEKEFRLDIKIVLNNSETVNIEMQVIDYGNWADRSLNYLCREFDELNRGQQYEETKPAVHISILDYTLFPDSLEFYASHKMMNIKNHHIYNDKFTLNVLDLNQITIATKEDKSYNIDQWASLFKATTWEEIKMISQNNQYLSEASNTLFTLNSEKNVRDRCRDREEAIRHERTQEKKITDLETENSTLRAENSVLQDKNASLQNENTSLLNKNSDLIAYIQSQGLKVPSRFFEHTDK